MLYLMSSQIYSFLRNPCSNNISSVIKLFVDSKLIINDRIYCFLCKNWNKDLNYAFPSISTIAKECLISERKVKDGIKWLKENKFIQVEKFRTSNGYCSNMYRIRYPVIDREQMLNAMEDEELEVEMEMELEEEEEEIEVEMKIIK